MEQRPTPACRLGKDLGSAPTCNRSDYGSKGWGFESLRAHFTSQSPAIE
jgi:hypothetical protein